MSEIETNLKIENAGWVSFLSVLGIILGAIYSFSIIGALIGVPLIFIGLKLNKAAKLVNQLRDDNDIATAKESINEFLKAFKIYGILVIIGFSIWVVAMVGVVVFGVVEGLNGTFF